MGINRRNFLKLLPGGLAAGVALRCAAPKDKVDSITYSETELERAFNEMIEAGKVGERALKEFTIELREMETSQPGEIEFTIPIDSPLFQTLRLAMANGSYEKFKLDVEGICRDYEFLGLVKMIKYDRDCPDRATIQVFPVAAV